MALPQPAVVVYGLVRNGFGAPYRDVDGATVELVREKDGEVLAEARLGSDAYGASTLNYRMTLEMDTNPSGARARAAEKGDALRVRVKEGTKEVGVIPAAKASFAAPDPGTPLRLDLTTGADSYGHGIPDDWVKWAIESNPRYGEAGQPKTVAEFDPNADYDGDGFSNVREFLAGTNPFDATEIFRITKFTAVEGRSDLLAITFTTVEGRHYRVMVSDELAGGDAAWAPAASAAKPGDEPAVNIYEGTGYGKTVYVPRGLAEKRGAFYHVAVE